MWTSIDVNWIELTGYAASALVFLTFYMKTMIPLRVVGILSNVVFMAYGLGARIYPILILHAILLPLNCIRLVQMRALIRKVRDAAQGELSMQWLMPFMHRRHVAKGETLFRRGGSVLGEIGIVAPTAARMDTAMCETDADVSVVGNDKVLQLYHQNPKLGFYLIRLVIQRLLENYVKLRDATGGAATSKLARDVSRSP